LLVHCADKENYQEKSPNLWRFMERDMRVIHYTLAKPFPPYSGGLIEEKQLREHFEREKLLNNRYAQELTWWEDAWNTMQSDNRGVLALCDAT
jgi:hypothetical protein